MEIDMFQEEEQERWAEFEDEFDAQGFTMIHNAVMREPELSLKAKAVYGLLKSFAWQDPHCFPGQEVLLECCSDGERAFRAGIDECTEFGIIERHRRGRGRTNLYIFKKLQNVVTAKRSDKKLQNAVSTRGATYAGDVSSRETKTQFTNTQNDPHVMECVRILEEMPSFPRKDIYEKMLKKTNLFPDVDAPKVCRALVNYDDNHPGETKNYWARLNTFFEKESKWLSGTRTPNKPSQAVSGPHSASDGTPEPGLEALRTYQHPRFGYNDLKELVPIAERWDFSKPEEPPWPIMKEMKYDHTLLKRVQKVVRRALERA